MAEEQGKQGGVLARHCPRLGHPIVFSYCMGARMNMAGETRPCDKILDCWWETFDIQKFLRENTSADVYEDLINQQPKARGAGLFDAIQQALENKDK